ncbi:hypothetical protein ACIBVL_06530 [Streptomyces sp. NPDC049687]|uniref:hypothetical protein n=1 Tax=Streptomyces sp. NPDC049687 TaxID=3365596 RepID=UPI0037B71AD2
MAPEPTGYSAHFLLDTDWNGLVNRWATGIGAPVHDASTHITLSVPPRPAGADHLQVHLTTSRRFLVAFMTTGRSLAPGELARAAAAANAWNIQQLIPTLSVWNVRGSEPHLGGVCTLPLSCRMTQRDFDATASGWVDQAATMFARCREVFSL